MNKKSLFRISLNLFNGEGAAEGQAEGSAQGENKTTPGTTRRGKSGDLSNVLYGSEADAQAEDAASQDAAENTGVQVTSNTLEENRKNFRDMIRGEYKDAFGEEVQRIIDRRFADYKALQKQAEAPKALLDKLSARYNVMDGDIAKLEKAIDNDNAYWAAAAEEAGMDVDQYREVQELRQQNAMLRKIQQEQANRDKAAADAQRWYAESLSLKEQFPGFDLAAELEDQNFVNALKAGVPVELAYKAKYFDTLLEGAMKATVSQTQQAVVNNIRAKGSRPTENGTASQSPFVIKKDVSQLTKADRAEIARRAMRGEKISF